MPSFTNSNDAFPRRCNFVAPERMRGSKNRSSSCNSGWAISRRCTGAGGLRAPWDAAAAAAAGRDCASTGLMGRAFSLASSFLRSSRALLAFSSASLDARALGSVGVGLAEVLAV